MILHLEFPFTAALQPRPGTVVPEPPTTNQQELTRRRVARRHKSRRRKAQKRMVPIVRAVAKARNVDWKDLFNPNRGHPQVAKARALAMALCVELDVPHHLVARAFDRSWATVYSAVTNCSRKYFDAANTAFRAEWDTLYQTLGPSSP